MSLWQWKIMTLLNLFHLFLWNASHNPVTCVCFVPVSVPQCQSGSPKMSLLYLSCTNPPGSALQVKEINYMCGSISHGFSITPPTVARKQYQLWNMLWTAQKIREITPWINFNGLFSTLADFFNPVCAWYSIEWRKWEKNKKFLWICHRGNAKKL